MKIACGAKTLINAKDAKWVEGTSAVAHEVLYTFAEHAGRYVAGARVGLKSYYSDDGVNWTEIVALSGMAVMKINYVNGYFFASGWKNNGVEDHVAIWKSVDGTTWSDISPAVGNTTVPGAVQGVAYKSGTYVAAAVNGNYYSTDLITWTLVAAVEFYYAVAANDDIFMAAGLQTGAPFHSVIGWSTDGIAWNVVQVETTNDEIKSVIYMFGKWYAIGDKTLCESSDGGLTWTNVYTRTAGGFMGIVMSLIPYGMLCFTDTTEYVFTENGTDFEVVPIDIVVGWSVEGFVVVESETNYPVNLTGYAQALVAAAGSIENIANAAVTGFTGPTQTAAVAAVSSKIPEMISEYETQMRRIHTVMTLICNAAGVTPPAAFPVISSVFYTAIRQLLDVRTNLESVDMTTIPDPSDEQQLNAIEGLGSVVEDAFGKADDVNLRMMSLFEVYIRDIG
jgi:hypothetical protein